MSSVSSLNNIAPIQLVPFTDNDILFTSSKLTVTKPIVDNSFNYSHMGDYVVSASSFKNDTCAPFHAFNNLSTSYWETDSSGNADFNNQSSEQRSYSAAYIQNPYSNSTMANSSYQGGGLKANNWSTMVGQNPIQGEWLQITLPSQQPIFLYKYSILTPVPVGGIMTFPSKFMVVGSSDGVNWDYVDQQNLSTPRDTSDGKPVVFNLNVTKNYNYYRLIVSEMFKQNSVLRINEWALYGTTEHVVNKETFVGMNSFSPITYEISQRKIKYVDYKNSVSLEEQNKKAESYILQNQKDDPTNLQNNIDTSLLLPGVLIGILALSFHYYSRR
uniref:F5/8 type C domain-containing protein n=1 Tax=viral metagenome TaxID=1070528 RepID=A0A6C0JI05_9ZZZZ